MKHTRRISVQPFSGIGFDPLPTNPKVAVTPRTSEYRPTDAYPFLQPQHLER
ncbi:MAG: hypothetical protein F6K50_14520 [Moorea sp. SIO3I7]|uniref:hypothetical protein n=1 Tax=unclassified Moorena TaxID=2683338 RepID=UPI0013C0064C|nr:MULTISPECIES: hypothetical protein [unclassified Moorena]NEN96698.1 hypothetical protein [Moorena sp. SIO3I7]NEO23053.1 hypothetical protein [Moorena sp. SIO4A5]NEO10236.1 hypothetical protein [Moorena sp. SIO3I8]NEP26467.1 hypothetical protein [Moorena sp. SIO3I6]NEQ61941.1 hypothetical protein [Moorena sp. SIO4A1]